MESETIFDKKMIKMETSIILEKDQGYYCELDEATVEGCKMGKATGMILNLIEAITSIIMDEEDQENPEISYEEIHDLLDSYFWAVPMVDDLVEWNSDFLDGDPIDVEILWFEYRRPNDKERFCTGCGCEYHKDNVDEEEMCLICGCEYEYGRDSNEDEQICLNCGKAINKGETMFYGWFEAVNGVYRDQSVADIPGIYCAECWQAGCDV